MKSNARRALDRRWSGRWLLAAAVVAPPLLVDGFAAQTVQAAQDPGPAAGARAVQPSSGLAATLVLDRRSLRLADYLVARVSVAVPVGSRVAWPAEFEAVDAVLGGFQAVSVSDATQRVLSGEALRVVHERTLTLEPREVGAAVVPAFQLTVRLGDGREHEVRTEAETVAVESVLDETAATALAPEPPAGAANGRAAPKSLDPEVLGLRQQRDRYSEPATNAATPGWVWLVIGAVCGVLGAAAWAMLRRRRRRISPSAVACANLARVSEAMTLATSGSDPMAHCHAIATCLRAVLAEYVDSRGAAWTGVEASAWLQLDATLPAEQIAAICADLDRCDTIRFSGAAPVNGELAAMTSRAMAFAKLARSGDRKAAATATKQRPRGRDAA